MSNIKPQITFKITINKIFPDTSSSSLLPPKPIETTLTVDRGEFVPIKSKAALTEFLSSKIESLSKDDIFLDYSRKSKKYHDFVPLETLDDFRALTRSLKVKNHINLLIEDHSPPQPPQTNQQQLKEQDKRKMNGIDFASLGDALFEAALEHFKELFADLAMANNTTNTTTSNTNNGTTITTSTTSTETSATAGSTETLPAYAPAASATATPAAAPPVAPEPDVIHPNICCDVCHPNDFVPLTGTRYCCLVCHNFDLCSKCEAKLQLEKCNFGQHSYLHPMAKVVDPSQPFPKFGRFGRCPYADIPRGPAQAGPTSHPRSPPPPPPPHFRHRHFGNHRGPRFDRAAGFTAAANETVLDIPVDNCPPEIRRKLEEAARTGDFFKAFDGCTKEIEQYIKDSERYNELIELGQAKEFDEDVKFVVLKTLVEAALQVQQQQAKQEEEQSEKNDQVMEDAEKYNELIDLVHAKEFDDDVKFAILKSLIEAADVAEKSKKEEDQDMEEEEEEEKNTPTAEEEEEIHEEDAADLSRIDFDESKYGPVKYGKVSFKPKKTSENSRIISVLLTNHSDALIQGGNLQFEFFYNDGSSRFIIVKNANDIKPGQQRFYNLGNHFGNEMLVNGMKVRIVSSNSCLEGEYFEDCDCMFSIRSLKEEEEDEIMEEEEQARKKEESVFENLINLDEDPKEGTPFSISSISRTQSPVIIDNPNHILSKEDEIQLTVIPKSSSLAQLLITNKSDKIFDCNNLKLEVLNCVHTSILSMIIMKRHGIMPGKSTKFNIGISTAHFKFPFKVILKNEYNICHVDLSNHHMSDKLVIDEVRDLENVLGGGSIHSIVLPSIPKESSLENSQYVDAIEAHADVESEKDDEEDEEDFDMISGESDEEETLSDFEILSSVSSNQ